MYILVDWICHVVTSVDFRGFKRPEPATRAQEPAGHCAKLREHRPLTAFTAICIWNNDSFGLGAESQRLDTPGARSFASPIAFLAFSKPAAPPALPFTKLERDPLRLVLSSDVIEGLSLGSCGFPDLACPGQPYQVGGEDADFEKTTGAVM